MDVTEDELLGTNSLAYILQELQSLSVKKQISKEQSFIRVHGDALMVYPKIPHSCYLPGSLALHICFFR